MSWECMRAWRKVMAAYRRVDDLNLNQLYYYIFVARKLNATTTTSKLL